MKLLDQTLTDEEIRRWIDITEAVKDRMKHDNTLDDHFTESDLNAFIEDAAQLMRFGKI